MFGFDLVRGIAIVLVLLCHFAGVACMLFGIPVSVLLSVAGCLGVELFFALSGVLIGELLLDIIERPVALRPWLVFLTRRWMRTIPLYVLWMTVLLVILPPAGSRLEYAVSYATFTQNFLHPMKPDQWFAVSWSLTVEEWFYLLFSAVLMGAAAVWPRRAVVVALGLFIVGGLACRVLFASDVADWGEGLRKVAVFRLDAIAYGVGVAWLLRQAPAAMTSYSRMLLPIGAAAIAAACVLLFADLSPYWRPWLLSLDSIGCCLCLPAARQLRCRWLQLSVGVRWLSERSYALYIVHFSLLQLAFGGATSGYLTRELCVPAAIVMSFLVADVSFRFFESPILKCRPRQFPKPDNAQVSAPSSVRSRSRSADQRAAVHASAD